MSTTPYQKVGNTIFVTAAATPGTGNIAPANASNSFSKIQGPLFIKVDNVDSANIAFLNWGPSSSGITATIANSSSSGTGICIQPKATEIIQLQTTGLTTGTATIYFSAASANTANLYITPVISAEFV